MCGKSWLIVGVGGVTNGGKTTLSSFLRRSFPGSIVVTQDDFFYPDDSPEHVLVPELNHKNWDCLASVDWTGMMRSVTEISSSEPEVDGALLVVDGHLVFNYPELEKLFQRKYYFTLDREECYKRRITRVYDPPDVPGYFEKVVWPMYLSNLGEVERNCRDVMYLNGSDKMEDLQETVMSDIKNYLSCADKK